MCWGQGRNYRDADNAMALGPRVIWGPVAHLCRAVGKMYTDAKAETERRARWLVLPYPVVQFQSKTSVE